MRHPSSRRVNLCGIDPPGRAVYAASPLEKGLPCGIDFEENRPCRLRLQHSGSPEAAPIKAEAANSSPAKVMQGGILGQKTAARLPHESRKAARKCRVFVGILRIL